MLFDSILCEFLQGCRASLSKVQKPRPCAQTLAKLAYSEATKIRTTKKWQHLLDITGLFLIQRKITPWHGFLFPSLWKYIHILILNIIYLFSCKIYNNLCRIVQCNQEKSYYLLPFLHNTSVYFCVLFIWLNYS